MRWFNKARSSEIWDEQIDEPIGDIGAAHRIRTICASAAVSAEIVGQMVDAAPEKRSERKRHEHACDRYERATRAAMETAMKMSDDLMRDASVCRIVELCLSARDMKTARILFRAIQTPAMRDEVLAQHPALHDE